MRKIFPIFAVVMGIFWIVMSFKYGLWVRRGPGGGFFPLIGGALVVIFFAAYLINEFRNPTPAAFSPKFIYPILAILAVLLSSYLIGLLPGLFLFILLWLRCYEKYPNRRSLCVSVGVIIGIYLVFVAWLAVPLPKGIWGEAVSEWLATI